MIVDAHGKPFEPVAESNCPKCGRPPTERVPSCGFGPAHMICPCGYEFEGKIPCKSVTP